MPPNPNAAAETTRRGCQDLLERAIDRHGRPDEPALLAAARGVIDSLARVRGLDPGPATSLLETDGPAIGWTGAQPPVGPEALGWLHEAWLAARAGDRWTRKAAGAFYTPSTLVAPLVTRAFAGPGAPMPASAPEDLRICDPACGGGAFLLGALRHLRRTFPDVAPGAWPSVLHGVDRDPHAVRLARAALWLEAGDPALPTRVVVERIRPGDALLGATAVDLQHWPHEAFDRKAGDAQHTGPHQAAGHRDTLLGRFRRDAGTAAPDWTFGDTPDDRDLWMAAWFWPAIALADRPFPVATPVRAEARALARSLADHLGFLHWDLAFEEVFAPPRGGFDLIVGNPPWDSERLEARTFFRVARGADGAANAPLSVGERHALCAASPQLESDWLDHCERHAARRNLLRRTVGTTGRAAPNLGLAFVARALDLLRPGGRIALLVPAALHADLGARALRRRLLEQDGMQVLVGFENRRKLFRGVDQRFKFDALIATRGRPATQISTAFMATGPEALELPGFTLDAATVRAASPRSLTIPEYREARERTLAERALAHGLRLGDDDPRGFRPTFRRELDLSLDARWFHERLALQETGYRPDRFDRWVKIRGGTPTVDGTHCGEEADLLPLADGSAIPIGAVEDVALPIVEGRMLGCARLGAKAWVSGQGRRAVWRSLETSEPARLLPRVLIRRADLRRRGLDISGPKVGFMAIGSATNAYAMVAAALPSVPCGNSVPCLRSSHDRFGLTPLAVLASMPFDALLRPRLAGLNLNRFTLDEALTPHATDPWLDSPTLRLHTARLAWQHPLHAGDWLALRDALPERLRPHALPHAGTALWRTHQLAALDAVVARSYGLTADDLTWICRDCDHPAAALREPTLTRGLDPKGLWRIDRALPPGQRRTVLAVRAMRELDERVAASESAEIVLEEFLLGHDGAGWRPDATPDRCHTAGAVVGLDELGCLARSQRALDEQLAP